MTERRLIQAARAQAEHASRSASEPASPFAGGGLETRPGLLPGYERLRELHRGGQGVVYRAIQTATRREVAIKVLRGGPVATDADRARFEREVRLLAALRHPNIVAVHDSGEIDGWFYCVMDYIAGRDLDEAMAARPRPVGETLELFARICEAVHAAHLRGIIHRDLKPSNIRVDDDGAPHILDFGLAKATLEGSPDRAVSVATTTGQFVGSMPWASPEQAEGRADGLDVRSDVYSLGVIACQMLTGSFPYQVSGPIREVLDAILHAEPAPPGRLARGIDGEVDTIVLKCLSKDRQRRYQSAGDVARDVRHHLAGRPIEARRDSFGYVLRKTLRRRWPVASAAAAFLVLLAVFAIAMARQSAVLAERSASLEQSLDRERDAGAALGSANARLAATLYARDLDAIERAWTEGFRDAAIDVMERVDPEQRDWHWRHYRWRADRDGPPIGMPGEHVTAVAYDPAGLRVAVGSWDGPLRVHAEGDPARVLATFDDLRDIAAVAFHPETDLLAAAGPDGVYVVNTASGVVIMELPAPVGGLDAISIAGAEPRVLAATPDGRCFLWDDGALRASFACTHGPPGAAARPGVSAVSGVSVVAVNAASGRVATGGRNVIRLWDAASGAAERTIHLLEHGGDVRALALSADGALLAASTILDAPDQVGPPVPPVLRVWDVEDGVLRATLIGTAHGDAFESVAFAADGDRVLAGSFAGGLQVWTIRSPWPLLTVAGPGLAVTGLAARPDGDAAIAWGTVPGARTWTIPGPIEMDGRGEPRPIDPMSVSASFAGASAAGHADGDGDGRIRLWDADSAPTKPARLEIVAAHRGAVEALCFLDGGRLLASGGSDGMVRIWDARYGLTRPPLGTHAGGVRALDFDEATGRLTSVGRDGVGRIWPGPHGTHGP